MTLMEAAQMVQKALATGELTPEHLGFLQSGSWATIGALGSNQQYVKYTYGDFENEYCTTTPEDDPKLVWLWALPQKQDT